MESEIQHLNLKKLMVNENIFHSSGIYCLEKLKSNHRIIYFATACYSKQIKIWKLELSSNNKTQSIFFLIKTILQKMYKRKNLLINIYNCFLSIEPNSLILLHTISASFSTLCSLKGEFNNYLLSGGSQEINLYSYLTGELIKTIPVHNIRGLVQPSWNLDCVIGGSDEGNLTMWDLKSGKEIMKYFEQKESGIYCITELKWNYESRAIALGHYNGIISIWNCNNNSLIRELKNHNGHQVRVIIEFIVDQEFFIISGGEDSKLKIWDLKDGICIYNLPASDWVGTIIDLKIEKLLLYGCSDGSFHLFDFKKKTIIKSYPKAHTKSLRKLCLISNDKDNSFVFSVSEDCEIKLWQIKHTHQC